MDATRRTTPPLTVEPPAPLRDEIFSPDVDGVADTEARVHCPCCGSPTTIGLDPGSGANQSYAEDCPVCCRAWSVTVHYGPAGRARVDLAREDL